jgi:GPH family glycoside/pentoside/hexuronide:cation symporter
MSPDGLTNTKADAHAWFMTMAIYAVAGFILLIFCFSQTRERVVMDKKETANVKVSDLWVEFMRNRPLRILSILLHNSICYDCNREFGRFLLYDL